MRLKLTVWHESLCIMKNVTRTV